MRLAFVVGGFLACAACLPDRPDPAPYLAEPIPAPPVTPPPRMEEPETPAPPPVLVPPGAVQMPRADRGGPDPIILPAPPNEPLPTAWSRHQMKVAPVAPRLARRIVATETPVAVLPTGRATWLVISEEGGLFAGDLAGGWRPQITGLPQGVTRAHQVPEGLLICFGEAHQARLSADHGQTWVPVPLFCGQEGRRTVAVGDALYALDQGKLRVGPLQGEAEWRPLPLENPTTLGADKSDLVVFNADQVAVSHDGGAHFFGGRRAEPLTLEVVRDVAFFGKSGVVAVGRSVIGQPGIVASHNLGRGWHPVARAPRGANDLFALSLNELGQGVATSVQPAPAFWISHNAARWVPEEGWRAVTGAPTPTGRTGHLVGAWRGLAHAVGSARAPARPGLDQPLMDIVFLHPLVAVGAGLDEGLFLSRDGGRTFVRIPDTAGARFNALDTPGDGRVVAVGAGVLWMGQADQLRWSRATPPTSCAFTWVSLAPGTEHGLAGCDDGQIAGTDDGGLTWQLRATLGAAAGRVLWLGEDQSPDTPATAAPAAIALSADGREIFHTEDSGRRWRASALPAVGVALAQGPEGPVLLLEDGRLAHPAEGPSGWRRWFPMGQPWSGGRPVGLHMTPDGGAVILGEGHLWRLAADGRGRPLAVLRDGRRLVATGDGGLMVLTDTAAALLEPR